MSAAGHVVAFRRIDGATGALPEWTLIELQGTLEAMEAGVSLDGLELGSLSMEGDEAHLHVGSHALSGKRVTLPKPLLVTHSAQPGAEPALLVDGVVRHKIVFRARPTSVQLQRE